MTTRPTVEPLAVKSKTAAAMLGLSTTTIDTLVAKGELQARRAGKVRLILTSSIRDYLEKLPDARVARADPAYRTQKAQAAPSMAVAAE